MKRVCVCVCVWVGGWGGLLVKQITLKENAKEENYLARRNIGIVSVFRKQS